MRPLLLLTGILVPLLTTLVPAFGQSELHPIATLAPTDLPPDYFEGIADSVAVWGDFIAVGVPYEALGAVYVFRRHGPTWIEQAKLTDPDGTRLDTFGYSVAMERDVIVAGAPQIPTMPLPCAGAPGIVHVFRRDDHGTPHDLSDDTWFHEARLTGPDPQWGDKLGGSVAISGDTIVAGNWCGSKAEVFRHQGNGWVHEGTLDGADPDPNAFGYSVDIDGDFIVGGAFGQDDDAGAAYIFRREKERWVKEDKLTASDAGHGDHFGFSVSISEQNVIVGAPGYDDSPLASEIGAAYLFRPTSLRTWEQAEKLIASALSHEFGFRVVLDGSLGLIINTTVARADLFERTGKEWEEAEDLIDFHSRYYQIRAAIQGRFAVVSTRVYVVRNHVNLRDLVRFQNCFSEMSVTELPPDCQPFDLTGDGRLALDDFERFMGTFAGP